MIRFILKDMCYADLIDASNTQPTLGGQNGDIQFDFIAFTFADMKVKLSMVRKSYTGRFYDLCSPKLEDITA